MSFWLMDVHCLRNNLAICHSKDTLGNKSRFTFWEITSRTFWIYFRSQLQSCLHDYSLHSWESTEETTMVWNIHGLEGTNGWLPIWLLKKRQFQILHSPNYWTLAEYIFTWNSKFRSGLYGSEPANAIITVKLFRNSVVIFQTNILCTWHRWILD